MSATRQNWSILMGGADEKNSEYSMPEGIKYAHNTINKPCAAHTTQVPIHRFNTVFKRLNNKFKTYISTFIEQTLMTVSLLKKRPKFYQQQMF